jgi:hypothetical protein
LGTRTGEDCGFERIFAEAFKLNFSTSFIGPNSFVSYADICKQNPQLAGGTIELVKETETQMIFKVSNLKIKRVGKDDFVDLNGFIYAKKK